MTTLRNLSTRAIDISMCISLILFIACAQKSEFFRTVRRIGIITYGKAGTRILGQKYFIHVSYNVGSYLRYYDDPLQKVAPGLFQELLPDMLQATTKAFTNSKRFELIPIDSVMENRSYHDLTQRCAISDAVSAHPQLAYFDITSIQQRQYSADLVALQKALMVDALLLINIDCYLSDALVSLSLDCVLVKEGNNFFFFDVTRSTEMKRPFSLSEAAEYVFTQSPSEKQIQELVNTISSRLRAVDKEAAQGVAEELAERLAN
jgi:hypothetical protein